MPNLHRLYKAGAATIVHASATPYRERSHFDGQDVLESGLARPGPSESGWLNRALAALTPGGAVNPRGSKAFAVGPVTPLVVRDWDGTPIHFKLESQMTTGSFKDRGTAVMLNHLL